MIGLSSIVFFLLIILGYNQGFGDKDDLYILIFLIIIILLNWLGDIKILYRLKYLLPIIVCFSIYQGYNTFNNSTAINGAGNKAQKELYLAARKTEMDSLFLIPPYFHGFRMLSERAIVVDAKSTPYVGTELMDWYERINDISGTKIVNIKDADEAYNSIDIERIILIKEKYNIDYFVLELDKMKWVPDIKPFYVNGTYAIFDVKKILAD